MSCLLFIFVIRKITAALYCHDIWSYAPKVVTKYPVVMKRLGLIMFHDNSKPHVSQITVLKLADLVYEILSHQPYLPDLSPTDYHLFKLLNCKTVIEAFKQLIVLKN